ncbi:uncharacterized protein UV8b_03076 [Ustilaginoidea virens]|uniref:Uncharacterized protein n=1 Tax=Ustilaginoidea virens TaxID=1159556 RepID=A0A8E5HNM2_USTVR|nr:uncharacterized protein UV8b_03076 [Ustilaginoidea virens]QUC18835.1 hypothetical protein UV8b_03076 [Ustilaginoidea virens]
MSLVRCADLSPHQHAINFIHHSALHIVASGIARRADPPHASTNACMSDIDMTAGQLPATYTVGGGFLQLTTWGLVPVHS